MRDKFIDYVGKSRLAVVRLYRLWETKVYISHNKDKSIILLGRSSQSGT
jgi:hypothetical protein